MMPFLPSKAPAVKTMNMGSEVLDDTLPNIIVFGETGVGKSSVVNMLDGDGIAPTSSKAVGETFMTTRYERIIGNQRFNVFDTMGLGEAKAGTVDTKKAVQCLYELVTSLSHGISLLVFVFRERIKDTTWKNYTLFHNTFCQAEVPVVIVVTGLEQEPNTEEWWRKAEPEFRRYGMHFNGHACITAIKGVQEGGIWSLQEEYDSSKRKVEELLKKSYNETPWKMKRDEWFCTILGAFLRILGIKPKERAEILAKAFKTHLKMAPAEARKEAEVVDVKAANTHPNIIVFGETGVGKSSVINMLNGTGNAPVSNKAVGETLSTTLYERWIGEQRFNVYDTAGLNEGQAGLVPAKEAIPKLWELICSLENGVNLLIFVMKGRIKATTHKNYQLFYETFCDSNVPIVILVTGLEYEKDMDQWWEENEKHFDKYKMKFTGHGCITAMKGRPGSTVEARYIKSKVTVEELVSKSYEKENPWTAPKATWFRRAITSMFGLFAANGRQKAMVQALVDYGGVSKSDAREMVRNLENKE